MLTFIFSIVLSTLLFIQAETVVDMVPRAETLREVLVDLVWFIAFCSCYIYAFRAQVLWVFSYMVVCHYCDFHYPVKGNLSFLSGCLFVHITAVGGLTRLSAVSGSVLACYSASYFIAAQYPGVITRIHRFTSRREERAEARSRGYLPLHSKRNEFRLLRLFPAHIDCIPTCALETFTLRQYPHYDALSYCWGQESATTCILVNGKEVKITKSLDTALRQLRHADEDRLLWIDRLCIDQGNLYERSAQVQIMRHIYSSARRVTVWLGPGNNSTDETMQLIREMNETPGTQLAELERYMNCWRNLSNLFQYPWWTRVWIIQEVAMAKEDPIVRCGREWVPWSYLINAFSLMIVRWTKDFNAPPGLGLLLHHESLPILDAIRQKILEGKEESLEWYIRATSGIFEATDARDKIYALLGLARDIDRKHLIPDYDPVVTEESLSARVVRHFINSESSLNILSFHRPKTPTIRLRSHVEMEFLAQHAHRFGPFSSFDIPPSWLPSFGKSKSELEDSLPFISVKKSHQASRGRPAEAYLSAKQSYLVAKGILFDIVQGRMEPCPSPILDPYLQEVDIFFRTALTHCNPRRSDTRSFLDRSESHWRTMVADMSPPDPEICVQHGYNPSMVSMTPAHPSLERMYEVLLRGMPCPAHASVFYGPPHQGASTAVDRYTEPFWRGCGMAMRGRSPFATQCGFVGLGPPDLRRGDVVAILFGADVPFILRPSGKLYRFVGDCYVHGISQGELVDLLQRVGWRSIEGPIIERFKII